MWIDLSEFNKIENLEKKIKKTMKTSENGETRGKME